MGELDGVRETEREGERATAAIGNLYIAPRDVFAPHFVKSNQGVLPHPLGDRY